MTALAGTGSPISEPDRFFIGGSWVAPSSKAKIVVIDPSTEDVYFSVAEAQAADMSAAITAARAAFDDGPWTQLTHTARAGVPARNRRRAARPGQRPRTSLARESGILYSAARAAS